jgi:hypothetical protein
MSNTFTVTHKKQHSNNRQTKFVAIIQIYTCLHKMEISDTHNKIFSIKQQTKLCYLWVLFHSCDMATWSLMTWVPCLLIWKRPLYYTHYCTYTYTAYTRLMFITLITLRQINIHILKTIVFWNVIPCNLVEVNNCFRRIYCYSMKFWL